MKFVEIKIQKGIKCDHCSWKDETLDWSLPFATITENIGRQCPECGHSLLTYEDAMVLVNQLLAAEKTNELLNKYLPNFVIRYFEKKKKNGNRIRNEWER